MNDLNPNNTSIKENLPRIYELIMNKNVTIYFVPSSNLRELISKNEHPYVKDIPSSFKAILLSGNGLLIQKKMVWNWLNGKLDSKNSWILSNGDLRVSDSDLNLVNLK